MKYIVKNRTTGLFLGEVDRAGKRTPRVQDEAKAHRFPSMESAIQCAVICHLIDGGDWYALEDGSELKVVEVEGVEVAE